MDLSVCVSGGGGTTERTPLRPHRIIIFLFFYLLCLSGQTWLSELSLIAPVTDKELVARFRDDQHSLNGKENQGRNSEELHWWRQGVSFQNKGRWTTATDRMLLAICQERQLYLTNLTHNSWGKKKRLQPPNTDAKAICPKPRR